MKKIILLFSIFLISTFSAISQAENFYVCDANGNDEFDGRSETKPFKTYDKAIWSFNKLDAGGSLLFCRGGEFEATSGARLSNSSCQANKPCSIADYGNENLPRPVIGAYGVHAINFENGGSAKPDGGYVVKNLVLIAAEKSGAGIRLFNDVDDVTISNVHVEGFNVGVYAANSNVAEEGSGSNEANDRIILKNSNIIHNRKIGFLGSCNDCLIEGNNFESNGTHPSLDHNIYLSGSKNHKKGITIRNNTLYRSAIVDGICQGVSLVGHGLLEDVLIENNIIKEDLGKVSGGCWGISIDPGYHKVDESFRNIVIRNNKVINVGGNGIGCASCEGVTIEGNEIIDEAEKINAGIRVPVREENTARSSNVIVKNNKVILSHEGATGIWIGGENVSHVTGNVIHLPSDTRVECISLNQANLKIDISTNTCKIHNGVSVVDPATDGFPAQDDELVAEDNTTGNESTDAITEPTEIIQRPITDVAINDGSSGNTPTEPSTTIVPDRATNGSEIGVNEQQTYDDSSTSMLNKEPRSAAGGGASSGGSSSSSTASTTNNEPAVTDGVLAYTAPVTPSRTSTSIMSIESEQIDITKSLPEADSESSNFSVKVKDVIEASRGESEMVDVTQCRAYAAGRCLMK